jgi:hypothetical protein
MDKLTTLKVANIFELYFLIGEEIYLCVTRPPHKRPIAIIATNRIPRMIIPVMLADPGPASCSGVADGDVGPAVAVAVGDALEAACTPAKASVVPTRKARTRRTTKKMANRRGM